jgi:hypothetical protein
MKNIKRLEEKILLRDEMLKFLLSGNVIEFEDSLKLNNEIAMNSISIKKMQEYAYSKLQEESTEWEFKMPSKLNN